jgi:hypothetical protein
MAKKISGESEKRFRDDGKRIERRKKEHIARRNLRKAKARDKNRISKAYRRNRL